MAKRFIEKYKIGNFIMLTVAGLLNAIGITLFLTPVELFDSGISGTSMLLAQITGVSLSVFLLLLNIPLFIFGLKKQGIVFTVYAVYSVAMYSLFAFIINSVIPINISRGSPFAENDFLLCSIFGGIISGIGSGLAIRFGGAMDGVEVLAVIFSKKIGITVGTFCFIYNAAVYIAAGIIFNSWIIPLYSVIAYYANLKIIDGIVEGIDRAKAAIIVTTKPREICDSLSAEFGTGATIIRAKGSYSDTEKSVVYFVVNRFQVMRMKNIVHGEDAGAYITINEIADIYKANESIS